MGVSIGGVPDVSLVQPDRLGAVLGELDDVEAFVGGWPAAAALLLRQEPARADGDRPIGFHVVFRPLEERVGLRRVAEDEFRVAVVVFPLKLREGLIAGHGDVGASGLQGLIEAANDRHSAEGVGVSADPFFLRVVADPFGGRPPDEGGRGHVLAVLLDQDLGVSAPPIRLPPDDVFGECIRQDAAIEAEAAFIGGGGDFFPGRRRRPIADEVQDAEGQEEGGFPAAQPSIHVGAPPVHVIPEGFQFRRSLPPNLLIEDLAEVPVDGFRHERRHGRADEPHRVIGIGAGIAALAGHVPLSFVGDEIPDAPVTRRVPECEGTVGDGINRIAVGVPTLIRVQQPSPLGAMGRPLRMRSGDLSRGDFQGKQVTEIEWSLHRGGGDQNTREAGRRTSLGSGRRPSGNRSHRPPRRASIKSS